MNQYNKNYNAFQIPQRPEDSNGFNPPNGKIPPPPLDMNSSESYYEIEYDSCPMPGVGKFVLKSQKIEPPEKDEIRELFRQMREIAREDRFLNYNTSKLYQKKVQQDNARILYKQGMFMKDFEDTYAQQVPFSSYYPNYQMMGYEQLRTYFTWRTKVRKGDIVDTSISYAFLYFYELLNNIGVNNPQDGLEKLMFFWNTFRVYNQVIDKYVIKWLKDYHIYYDLPWSFKEFITANNLGAHYPKVVNPDDNFDLYCSISKYDIRKSKFYNDDTVGFIRDCFDYVIHRLREIFSEKQILLDDFLFQPTKNMTPWTPFQDALFYPGLRHPDKRVVLSEKEIYVRNQNKWTFHTTITTESGKQLVGYVLKQMESVLRKAMKYKYKLSVGGNALSPITAEVLSQAGINLEHLVTKATLEFYREITKTVVKVDPEALAKIRQETLITQEKLIVPEQPLESAMNGMTIPEQPNALASMQNTSEPETGIPEKADVLASMQNTSESEIGIPEKADVLASMQHTAELRTAVPETAGASAIATTQYLEAATDMQPISTQASSIIEQSSTIIIAEDGQFVLNPEMLSTVSALNTAKTFAVPEAEPQKTATSTAATTATTITIPITNALTNTNVTTVPITAALTTTTKATDIPQSITTNASSDPWECLENALNDLEKQALIILWKEHIGFETSMNAAALHTGNIKKFAQEHNIMLEVLIDGINEKASDFVGDSLLDGDFAFYEDYTEQVKGMVKRIWQDKYPQESPIF